MTHKRRIKYMGDVEYTYEPGLARLITARITMAGIDLFVPKNYYIPDVQTLDGLIEMLQAMRADLISPDDRIEEWYAEVERKNAMIAAREEVERQKRLQEMAMIHEFWANRKNGGAA